VHIIIVLNPRS